MSDFSSERSLPRARLAELQLLRPPRRPSRSPYVPGRRLPRRPGDRREPLTLRHFPSTFDGVASSRGLDVSCAVELCLERAMLRRDLCEVGRVEVYPRLLELAATTTVARALPGAKARYLQMLVAARDGDAVLKMAILEVQSNTTDAVVDVPLRLFPRVQDVAVPGTFGANQLAEGLQLEIAAVSDGRTMSEWAVLTALRLSL